MSSQAHAERLAHALEGTGYIEAVNITFKEDQVNVLFRLLAVSNDAFDKWIGLIKKMLLAERANSDQAHAWKTDVSKPYFLKGDTLVYSWRVSVYSQQMTNSLDYFIRAIKGEKQPGPKVGEVTEMTFSGFTEGVSDRNVPKPGSKQGAYRGETTPLDRRQP